MKFDDLLNKVSDLPCFTVRFLAAGGNLPQIRLQIDRWIKDGRVIRLHKGLYTLAEPYTRIAPEPFYVANRLKPASYVSLQSALSRYSMIPEFVPAVTSITTGRPQTIETPLTRFEFRHIAKKHFWGYRQLELTSSQTAFFARPEKALLDLIYMTPGGDKQEYIEELRLQNFEQIDTDVLKEFAHRFQSPKIERAFANIEELIHQGEGIEL